MLERSTTDGPSHQELHESAIRSAAERAEAIGNSLPNQLRVELHASPNFDVDINSLFLLPPAMDSVKGWAPTARPLWYQEIAMN